MESVVRPSWKAAGPSWPKRGTAALPIVVDIDVLEDRVGQLQPDAPRRAVEELDLHCAREGFDHCIVISAADRPHAASEPRVSDPRREE